jgi:multiple sugar transport system substrate-binding protein
MPYFLDSIALFYNKKLFDEAHVPYPNDNWTLDDVEKAGLKLTDKSKGQYGYIAQTAEAQKQYFNTIFEEGGNLINKDGTKSEFDSPETRSAFEWMQKLINEGVSPTGKQQAETAPDQLFASGKAAMIQMISVNAASMYKSLGKNLGIAMLPKGKQRGVVVSGIGWAMNNHTQHQDLAWELMKSLTDKQSGQYVAESGFSIPAYKGSEQEWVKSIPDVNLQAFIDDLKYGVPIPNTENAMEWWSVMGTEVQKMFFGEESIDQATKNVADKMNQVIAASNK